MSLEKKSTHIRLPDDMHHRLKILAGLNNNDAAEHAAILLEKAIMGEWHVVNVQMERASRLGLAGKIRELQTEVDLVGEGQGAAR